MMKFKHDLWNLPTKITFFFLWFIFFIYFFWDRALSDFAKPNLIVYDECFYNDLKKIKLNVKNKKITNI